MNNLTEQRHHTTVHQGPCMVLCGVTNLNGTETQHWSKYNYLDTSWYGPWISKPTETLALA